MPSPAFRVEMGVPGATESAVIANRPAPLALRPTGVPSNLARKRVSMRYELAISLRYFRSRRSDGAMTFISWVAALGVTLGVAALVVAMAVMNGYRANLTRAMSGALPHLRLYPSVLGSLPPVETLKTLFTGSVQPVSISSYVRHQTLIRGPHLGKGEVRGVLIRGIDPAVESKVPDLLAFVRDGSPGWAELPWEDRQERARKVLLGLKTPRGDGIAPVLLSPRLAKLLGVKLGDRLIPLKFPEDGSGFTPLPLPTRLEAAGFFELGIPSVDELFMLMDLDQVAKVFPEARLQRAVGFRFPDPLDAMTAEGELRLALARRGISAHVYSWINDNRQLFETINLQRWMLFGVLLLIVILALFGMASGLVMMVAEKSREITVLRALGARGGAIYRIFMVQGLLIGLVGTGMGVALGLGASWALDTFDIFTIPPGVYPGSDRVPVRVEWLDVAMVAGAAIVISLITTYIPARKAASILPVDGLRGE